MVRAIKFCLLLLLSIISVRDASAQETRTVSAEGVASIQQGAVDMARDAALEDAQKRAVEQAIGILIDSQTQVENYQLISDKILSQTKGYISRYNVTGETQEGPLLRVRITAEVSLGKLNDDLSAIGVLLGQMHKPRTMIMIAEQNIGHEWYAWWLGYHGEQTDIGVVENTFMDVFTQKGFEFIDHATAAKEIRVTSAYKTQDLSVEQARTLGNQADAEVVIVGKALAKLYGDIGGGMKSVQADISAKAVRTDTGQVIATATAHAAAVHITDTTAGIEALKKASNQAAEQMMEKILAVYSQEAGGTRPISITITGLNKTQFVKFKDALRNQVRGIKDLHERSFNGTTARISVDSKVSAQTLSDDLLLRDFGTFTVEVVSSTPNSLELKVTPK
ncbi:MAG TPA: flagellar assembly protein T N-terminal domain-containing protein [Nitrospirota bacterium]|nr:flagellar assembly protein T N-terminal domain-containing protein [Nitrospirota bacterium]